MIWKFIKWVCLALLLYFTASSIVIAHKVSEMDQNCKPGQSMSNKVQYLTFSRSKYPHIVAHIEESWMNGYPKILKINRRGADRRRDKLLNTAAGLRKWPRRSNEDRDEAPAASLRDTVKADVKYVDDHENQSAGVHLRNQMAPWCDKTRVRYRFIAFSSSRARGAV